MRVRYLQHVPFEGLGSMEPALRGKGADLKAAHLYAGQPLPAVEDMDWLIVMGGPMGIRDEEEYPWLRPEKALVAQAIEAGKTVLGVCLGAQIIADALGAKVYRNRQPEIGWFDIRRLPEAADTVLAQAIPPRLEAFHWHGDTFDIPRGACPLAASQACRNQGFVLRDRVVALQFHLEMTPQTTSALIENCGDALKPSRYVQSASELLSDRRRFAEINQVMGAVLEALAGQGA